MAGFTATGIRLGSGDELPADAVVTATGLSLLFFGGLRLSCDGVAIDPADRVTYKGMMLDGVPNLAFAMGYTNSSWTLKVDLVVHFVARILRRLDRTGRSTVVPTAPAELGELHPLIDFSSGYIRRGIAQMPKQGARTPWRLHQSYPRDLAMFWFGRLRGDGCGSAGDAGWWQAERVAERLELDPVEQRVLGALLEKQRTVPDSYPLSLNGLRTACNQSTSRDPVVAYDETTLVDTLGRLRDRALVRFVKLTGIRVVKYHQRLEEQLNLDAHRRR